MSAAGTYIADVQSAKLTASRKGNPSIAITFMIRQAMNEQTKQFVNCKPFRRNVYLSLFQGAVPYTLDKLRNLGFNKNVVDPEKGPGNYLAQAFSSGHNVSLSCIMDTNPETNREQERWDLTDYMVGDAAIPDAPAPVVQMFENAFEAFQQQAPNNNPMTVSGEAPTASGPSQPATAPAAPSIAAPKAPVTTQQSPQQEASMEEAPPA